LRETPARFLRAWEDYTQGYKQDPVEVLKTFEDGAQNVDEMVLVRDIPVYSHCEHHLAPFFGVAHVGYIPNGRVVGLSKLARLVDVYARRLQVQERLTQQVAYALHAALSPVGVGVVVKCRHLCMEARGVMAAGTSTVTSCMLGALREEHSARAELLRLIEG
jgi:GTP cyclohydrolase I